MKFLENLLVQFYLFGLLSLLFIYNFTLLNRQHDGHMTIVHGKLDGILYRGINSTQFCSLRAANVTFLSTRIKMKRHIEYRGQK